MSDAAALDWLDRLLAADEPERRATLEALAGTDPELHARLQRLLAHALAPEDSKFIAAPVLAGVNQLSLDATRAMQPGDVLAGYRLIRELGRGGMSVVWLAERADGVVKRHVALKMPMFMLQGAGDVERFARERDAGRYRGCIDLGGVMPELDAMSVGLRAKRTPRIMVRAWRGELHHDGDGVEVPRGCGPVVPPAWLTHGFVFAAG